MNRADMESLEGIRRCPAGLGFEIKPFFSIVHCVLFGILYLFSLFEFTFWKR